jgi:hypothetical protein
MWTIFEHEKNSKTEFFQILTKFEIEQYLKAEYKN